MKVFLAQITNVDQCPPARGKFDSEGRFTVSANDTNDGCDVLNWMAAQTWSTGKIGTYGCSYLGEIRSTCPSLETRTTRLSQHFRVGFETPAECRWITILYDQISQDLRKNIVKWRP